MERHVQTILVAMITGALMFLAGYVWTDNTNKTATKFQLEALTTQVSELRTEVRDIRQNFVRRDEFADHELRIRKLEQGVKHER